MNRLAYRTANRLGYRLGFCELTESVSGPDTDSGTESPHVRAIAACPVLSRPFQTCPVPRAFHTWMGLNFQNGNGPFCCESEVEGSAPVTGQAKEESAAMSRRIPRRGVRHPHEAVKQARELYEGGWTDGQIVRILGCRGYEVTKSSVRRWTRPKAAEASLRHTRKRARGLSGRLGSGRHSVEYQETRVRALAAQGVTYLNIARVMAFDYPDSTWNDDRVRKIVGPSRARKVAA